MSLGILGGTFNPIHMAHLRLAETARETLGLAQVLFVPSADPPHKRTGLAEARHRLEMVRLATGSNAGFDVLELELRRRGPSYTIDTLRELRGRHPGRALWFLMGTDSLAEMDGWHEADSIFRLAHIAVAQRRGAPLEPPLELLPPRLREQFRESRRGLEHRSGHEIRILPFAPLEISASDIRQRIARGASVRYLVPHAVIDHIEKNRLYRPDREGS